MRTKTHGTAASLALLALSLLPLVAIDSHAQLWDTDGTGGFTNAERLDWIQNYGPFSSVDEATTAAYDWCKTTSQYQNPAIDCQDHALFDDVVDFYGPTNPAAERFTVSINMYRHNGLHGNARASWYPYYTTEANCPTGQVIGPDNYNCIDPEYYVENPTQDCVKVSNNKSNPCDPANGNKSQLEQDYSTSGEGRVVFDRYYNSHGACRTGIGMGAGWRHTYSRAIDERPDTRPAVTFAAPVAQSSSYTTAASACTSGWDEIKADVWGRDLSAASATFAGGNTCRIESGGSAVAYFPTRARFQWNGFSGPSTVKTVTWPSGASVVFELDGSVWSSALNPAVSLEQSGSNWVFTDADDTRETYNSSGQLISITYRNGQTETLAYALSGSPYDGNPATLDRVTGPFGHVLKLQYQYGRLDILHTPSGQIRYYYAADSSGRLTSVRNLNNKYRTYVYEDADLPNHLTGIVDENNDRYATWAYDDAGRAILSEHADGQEQVQFAYNANGTTTLTMGDGAVSTYAYAVEQGTRKLVELTGDVCSTCPGGEIAERTYDSNGFLDESTDWNGNVTKTARNSAGLVETLTEGYGSAVERQTDITWHSSYRLPTEISTEKNDTQFSHDTNGNVTAVTITDGTGSRTWSYSYSSSGQVLTVNGPRTDLTDLTTLEYYVCTTGASCGQLKKLTNALNQVTTFNTYDAAGRLTKMTDANGLQTAFTYHAQGYLLTVKLTPTAGSIRTTTMTYDSAGQLATQTMPNGLVLTYAYTAAHYLESVTDNLGNSIQYDYDAMGNVQSVDTYDPGSTLSRALGYAYDLNGRLDTLTSGGFDTDLDFDAVGNLTGETDPALALTQHSFDALNRLEQTIDALSGVIEYGYDAHDNPVSVTAANGATTTFDYDDLDNLIEEISPDRGTTTYTHDAAGNVATMTDARGKVTSYTYDALDRLTEIELNDSSTIAFQYDTGTNAIGRLNKITDTTGQTTWSYNNFGEVTAKSQTIGSVTLTTQYAYDSTGRMSTMTLPSGKVVTYGYSSHLPVSVTVDATTILSGATYDPFGPVNGWSWGNSTAHSRSFDLRGLLDTQSIVTDTRTLTYDDAGRLITLDDARHDLGFDYNALGQLTDFTASGSAPLPAAQAMTYDENGNRESLTQGSTYTYSLVTNSNRLTSNTGPTAKSFTYDAAGNVTSDNIHSYGYDDRGRLVSVDSGAVTYAHNGQGQRVRKDDGTETLFAYDETGQLIGEYDQYGTALQETVWFNGAPVAVLVGTNKYYVHTDHLGTPRAISNGNTVIWRWESDPFGTTSAQEDPDGDMTDFVYNLRFPGQYFDQETGLHYNYFRDYDPGIGRYVQSDSIGLAGGLNSYLYAYQDPMSYTDPTGEFVPQLIGALIGAGLEYFTNPCATISDIAVAGALGAIGGGLAKLGATAIAKGAGPASNWLRYGPSYSRSLNKSVAYSLSWGASAAKSGKYINQIPNATLRQLNQWLRQQRIPLPGNRFVGPGHLHIKF